MNNSKDLDQIIKALDNVRKVSPPESLIKRMEDMAVAYGMKDNRFGTVSIMGIAASFLLLLMVNVYTIKSSPTTSKDNITLASDYSLTPINTLYNE